MLCQFSSEATKQSPPTALLRDVFQQWCCCESCECTAALSLLPEEMETNTTTIGNEEVQSLDLQKWQQLCAELCALIEKASIKKQ